MYVDTHVYYESSKQRAFWIRTLNKTRNVHIT